MEDWTAMPPRRDWNSEDLDLLEIEGVEKGLFFMYIHLVRLHAFAFVRLFIGRSDPYLSYFPAAPRF
jgi:hypothetical protein